MRVCVCVCVGVGVGLSEGVALISMCASIVGPATNKTSCTQTWGSVCDCLCVTVWKFQVMCGMVTWWETRFSAVL